MKLAFEVVLALFFHPVAMVLCWINIALRSDLGAFKKIVWLLVTMFWGVGPILYVLVGDGKFF